VNRTIKWCPHPSCTYAVQALAGGVTDVRCESCGTAFCFQCREDAHEPLSCAGLARWRVKCRDDSETANWFQAHARKCPNCNTFIEKNQGCNHMSCAVCRFEFCWVCMGKWSTHGSQTGGYYSCNRYDPEREGSKSSLDAKSAKRDLDKYMHYYTRYMEHSRSLNFANKTRADAEKRMTDLQQKGGHGWIDVQYIMDAVNQVIENRRALMHSYALAYFLPDSPQKTLFEYNQEQLEAHTERLQEGAEAVDQTKVDRASIINLARVTGNFLRKLVEQVHEDNLNGMI